MRSILRILPVALALFTTPAIVIPSVVEGPGCVVARMTSQAIATEVEYHEPRIPAETPLTVVKVTTPSRIPLRGASTPRAPAA
jgi:hypothetical protein